METISKKKTTKNNQAEPAKEPAKRISKMAQMWEKYPNGTIEILDWKAVLK